MRPEGTHGPRALGETLPASIPASRASPSFDRKQIRRRPSTATAYRPLRGRLRKCRAPMDRVRWLEPKRFQRSWVFSRGSMPP